MLRQRPGDCRRKRVQRPGRGERSEALHPGGRGDEVAKPRAGNAGATQKIADYWAISEEGLNALPDSKFQDIRNTGALAAVYAHMVSLMNWQRVIQRTMRRLSAQPTN